MARIFCDLTDLISWRRFHVQHNFLSALIKLSEFINLTRRVSWSPQIKKKPSTKIFSLSNITRCRLECYMLSSLCRWLHTHMLKNLLSTWIALCSASEKKSIIIWRTTKSFSKHLSRFDSTQKKNYKEGRENDDDEMRILSFLWLFCCYIRAMYFFCWLLLGIAKSQTNTIRCVHFSYKLLWTGSSTWNFLALKI